MLLNGIAHRKAFKSGEVRGTDDHAGLHVDEARHANANAAQGRESNAIRHTADHFDHVVDDTFRPSVEGSWGGNPLENLASFTDCRDTHVGAAEIHAD